MKKCTRCSQEQPIDAFNRRAASRKDGLSPICRACTTVWREQRREKVRANPRPIPAEKHCPSCQETKPSTEYNRNSGCNDGLHYWCKPCTALKGRNATLKSKYGIDHNTYLEMLAAQGGGCAICGRPPGRVRHPVDHDHKTGRVRAILCHNCNRGIGYLQDSPDTVFSAFIYLVQHREALAKADQLR